MNDNVNHPPHYNSSDAQCECGRRIECIDVTRHLSFNIGNAIKYLWRCEHKGSKLEDLKKARWYIEDQIKSLEDAEADNTEPPLPPMTFIFNGKLFFAKKDLVLCKGYDDESRSFAIYLKTKDQLETGRYLAESLFLDEFCRDRMFDDHRYELNELKQGRNPYV